MWAKTRHRVKDLGKRVTTKNGDPQRWTRARKLDKLNSIEYVTLVLHATLATNLPNGS